MILNMKKKSNFGLKVLSMAMIVSLMVPSSIGNIVTFAETPATTQSTNTADAEQTFSFAKAFPIQKKWR